MEESDEKRRVQKRGGGGTERQATMAEPINEHEIDGDIECDARGTRHERNSTVAERIKGRRQKLDRGVSNEARAVTDEGRSGGGRVGLGESTALEDQPDDRRRENEKSDRCGNVQHQYHS